MTPASNPLVPVTVTDKNGVQGIRWKRPDSPTMKQAAIPPVKPAAPVSHVGVLRKDFRPVSKMLLYTTSRIIKAMYRRENMLSQLSPDTLDNLNSQYGDNPEAIHGFIEECVRYESLIPLNNASALIDCANDPAFTTTDSPTKTFYRCISGLQKYEGCADVDYSLQSDAEREDAKVLIRAAAMLDKNGEYVLWDTWKPMAPQCLKSEELAALFKRRPDDIYTIVDILKERTPKADTPEEIAAIENILDSGISHSLLNGVL